MEKTQRQIMLFMPLIFVFFIISFPAGVIVYWITTNSWTILQQYIVKRRLGPPVPPATPVDAPTAVGGSSSRATGPRSGVVTAPKANGSTGAGGALGALLRRAKPAEETAGVRSSAQARAAPPPRPPRKKKKRSGRRR
jgi:YidC/Oxa1 family membrane protein insertase